MEELGRFRGQGRRGRGSNHSRRPAWAEQVLHAAVTRLTHQKRRVVAARGNECAKFLTFEGIVSEDYRRPGEPN